MSNLPPINISLFSKDSFTEFAFLDVCIVRALFTKILFFLPFLNKKFLGVLGKRFIPEWLISKFDIRYCLM